MENKKDSKRRRINNPDDSSGRQEKQEQQPAFKFSLVSLDEDLQVKVLSFLDPKSLLKFRKTSKASKALAEKDDLWEPFLQKLLQQFSLSQYQSQAHRHRGDGLEGFGPTSIH